MKLHRLLSLVFIISLLIACSPNNNDTPTEAKVSPSNRTSHFRPNNNNTPIEDVYYFSGTINNINKNNIALVNIEEGEILSSGSEVTVNLSVAKGEKFKQGDSIEVGYDGVVRETHPLQINTISVQLIE